MAFQSKTVTNVEEFLRLARDRFKLDREADSEDVTLAKSDVKFEAGDQWPEKARKARTEAGRPCMTENKLPVYVNQVTNDGRQNKPAIQTTPLDGGTPTTAEYFQGRIRHIEYESDADIAYDDARRAQIVSGRGAFRVITRYKEGSFDQELVVEPIEDQFSVVWDAYAKKYDRSDAGHCFIDCGIISKEEFKRRYGKDAPLAQANFFSDGENPAPEWVNLGVDEGVRIAEYWLKTYTTVNLCEMADGSSVYEDEIPADLKDLVKQKRPEQRCKLYQYIIDGVSIHDETEWLTCDIPIIPMWGLKRVVDGKVFNDSLIRNARTPQELVNLFVSGIAEQTAMLPKTPWMVPVGSIPDGQQDAWDNITTDPRAHVAFNQYDAEGRELREPKREVSEPPIQALTIGLNQAIDAIKAAMGIFDASLGAKGNETSGIAIQRRQKEADNANFHFHDNEARSRRRLGRILIPLIKKIDAGEGDRTIREEDGKTRTVKANTPAPYQDEQGKTVHYQLDQGDYGVAVKTGPSFTSQREEAADRDGEMIKAVPELIWVFGDQYFRNLDSPGSQERADRMERAIGIRTPGLIDQKPKDGQESQIPPEMQGKIQEAITKRDQLIDHLTKEVQTLSEEIKTHRVQVDSRERVDMARLQLERERLESEILLEHEKMGSKEAIVRLQEELANIRGDIAHERSEIARREQMASDERAAEQAQQQAQQQAPAPGDAGSQPADQPVTA